jgi:hypothetical protein
MGTIRNTTSRILASLFTTAALMLSLAEPAAAASAEPKEPGCTWQFSFKFRDCSMRDAYRQIRSYLDSGDKAKVTAAVTTLFSPYGSAGVKTMDLINMAAHSSRSGRGACVRNEVLTFATYVGNKKNAEKYLVKVMEQIQNRVTGRGIGFARLVPVGVAVYAEVGKQLIPIATQVSLKESARSTLTNMVVCNPAWF